MCLVYVCGVGGVTGKGVPRDQITLLEYGTPAAISRSAAPCWGTGHPEALASADPGPATSCKVALTQRPRLPTSVCPSASSQELRVPTANLDVRTRHTRHTHTHTLPTTHQQLLASTPKAPGIALAYRCHLPASLYRHRTRGSPRLPEAKPSIRDTSPAQYEAPLRMIRQPHKR